MAVQDTNEEASTLALTALGWTLQDEARAGRFLDLTGLTPDGLRAEAGTVAVQGGVIRFLEAHEPDLIACAEAIGTTPERLVRAREVLER